VALVTATAVRQCARRPLIVLTHSDVCVHLLVCVCSGSISDLFTEEHLACADGVPNRRCDRRPYLTSIPTPPAHSPRRRLRTTPSFTFAIALSPSHPLSIHPIRHDASVGSVNSRIAQHTTSAHLIALAHTPPLVPLLSFCLFLFLPCTATVLWRQALAC